MNKFQLSGFHFQHFFKVSAYKKDTFLFCFVVLFSFVFQSCVCVRACVCEGGGMFVTVAVWANPLEQSENNVIFFFFFLNFFCF